MSTTTSLPPPGNIGYAVIDNLGNVLTVSWMTFSAWQSGAPTGAIALSQQQFTQIYLNPGQYIYANGTIQLVPSAPALASVQSAACTQIDGTAETCRQQFITTGIGQMLVYQAKSSQALAFLTQYPTDAAAKSANPNNWPLLQAEIDITGSDLWNVAQVIAEIGGGWELLAGMIEQIRLGAKTAINVAMSSDAVKSIVAGTVFPSVGIPATANPSTGSLSISGGVPVVTV